MEWVVMAIGKRQQVVDIWSQAEGNKEESPE